MANETKVYNVVDVHTGTIWKSNKNHKATTFNNHEVVRIDANIMSLVQARDGVTTRNIEAKRYIADLINKDLKTAFKSKALTAPLVLESEKPVLAVTNAQISAVADETEEFKQWLKIVSDAIAQEKDLSKITPVNLKAKINALDITPETKAQLITKLISEPVKKAPVFTL